MTLLQQCRIWYKNKEFQRIVNTMEALPFDDWTPALAGILEKARKSLKEQMEKNVLDGTGQFTGQILLTEPRWDKQKLIRRLASEWGLKAMEKPNQKPDSLLFFVGNTILSVCLISSPVPNGQAERAAASNYLWPEAEERTRAHTARIFVGAMGDDASLLDRGRLLVEVLASCCDQENALGVLVNGTVYETRLYETLAKLILLNRLPVDNWIWFSFFHDAGGVSCYTRGMRAFGKEELEAVHCGEKPPRPGNWCSALPPMSCKTTLCFTAGRSSTTRTAAGTPSPVERAFFPKRKPSGFSGFPRSQHPRKNKKRTPGAGSCDPAPGVLSILPLSDGDNRLAAAIIRINVVGDQTHLVLHRSVFPDSAVSHS